MMIKSNVNQNDSTKTITGLPPDSDATTLLGATWASPPALGSTTPAAVNATTLNATTLNATTLGVTGTSTLGGNAAFRVYTVSGTMPVVGGAVAISFPTGVTLANIMGVTGTCFYGNGNTFKFPPNDYTDVSGLWRVYFAADITVLCGTTATNIAGRAFRLLITTLQ